MQALHRRRHPRQHLGARACIYGGPQAVPCVVFDISQGGARLEVDAGTPLPPRFDLFVSAAQPLQECRKVWCNGGFVGISFV